MVGQRSKSDAKPSKASGSVAAQKMEIELEKTLKELQHLKRLQSDNQDTIDSLRSQLAAERESRATLRNEYDT